MRKNLELDLLAAATQVQVELPLLVLPTDRGIAPSPVISRISFKLPLLETILRIHLGQMWLVILRVLWKDRYSWIPTWVCHYHPLQAVVFLCQVLSDSCSNMFSCSQHINCGESNSCLVFLPFMFSFSAIVLFFQGCTLWTIFAGSGFGKFYGFLYNY